MRQLTRLIRYALPYWWQILSSVLLMAAVGGLDAFKYLLVRPVFDRVLNPCDRLHRIFSFSSFPARTTPYTCSNLFPSHFTNAWNIVAFALVASTILKGICDYSGTYLGESRRFRHDHRSARRSLHCDAAPLGSIFFQTHYGDVALHHHQRHRAGAVRHVDRALGTPAAVLHFCFGGDRGRDPGRKSFLGFAAVCARDCFLVAQDRFAAYATPRGTARTSWRKFRIFCTKPSPATAS